MTRVIPVVLLCGCSLVAALPAHSAPTALNDERMMAIAAWREKLAALAPSAPTALLGVRVLDHPNPRSSVIETSGASARDFGREQSIDSEGNRIVVSFKAK
jgi:hypothetical protein